MISKTQPCKNISQILSTPQYKNLEIKGNYTPGMKTIYDIFDCAIGSIGILEEKYLKNFNVNENRNIDKLISGAEKIKRLDVYHSTTIEGYSVSQKLVDTILFGDGDKKVDISEIENILVIKGYSTAFDYLINTLRNEKKITLIKSLRHSFKISLKRCGLHH